LFLTGRAVPARRGRAARWSSTSSVVSTPRLIAHFVSHRKGGSGPSGTSGTLVIYIFRNFDPTSYFAFFFHRKGDSGPSGASGTLIIYIFRNLDPESFNNLIHFITHGIDADDGSK
jgi:hypothetical protein